MIKVVSDSSVIVKWINKDDELRLDKADGLLSDVQAEKVQLMAPELAKYEAGNAILKKGLTTPQAFQSLATVYGLPVQFIPETEELANLTYQIAYQAKQHGGSVFTYYDASFVALAQQENAVLVTDNPKHQKETLNVKVVPLEKYALNQLGSKNRTRKK